MGHSSFIFCLRFPPSFLPLSCYSTLSTYRDMLLKQEFGNCLVLRSTIEGETCNWQYPLSSYILFLPQKKQRGMGKFMGFLEGGFCETLFSPPCRPCQRESSHKRSRLQRNPPLFSFSPLFPEPTFSAQRHTHHLLPPSLHPSEFFPPHSSCCASSSYLSTTHFRFLLKNNVWKKSPSLHTVKTLSVGATARATLPSWSSWSLIWGRKKHSPPPRRRGRGWPGRRRKRQTRREGTRSDLTLRGSGS